MLCTELCLFYFKEDNCGKDGRAKPPPAAAAPRGHKLPELESMYRLNGTVYDFGKNDTVSLEGWINFEAEIDRMFALVSELNRCNEIWEMLSEVQVSEIHYCTCFLLWMIPHLLHNAFCSKRTPLTPGPDGKETQPSEDPRPGGQSVRKDSGKELKMFFSSAVSSRCHEKNVKAKYNSKARLRTHGRFCF